ncbi:MAG: redoxin domain-containing protein [Anaerolineales bacterium]|nr:redoxin domain-containing protein [Anaerolineales bacterium]
MKEDYYRFAGRGAVILAVGPNDAEAFQRYWQNERIPFIGLPDPDHTVARLYRQEVNLFKLGRMPLNCVIDQKGNLRFAHYGKSMRDIPSNRELFRVIDELNASSN